MKRHLIFSLGVAFAICLLAGNGALAQTGTTSLHGIVADQSGAAITGARVMLNNAQQGLHREAVTEAGAELVRFACSVGLVRGEWVAIDGSKLKLLRLLDSTRRKLVQTPDL